MPILLDFADIQGKLPPMSLTAATMPAEPSPSTAGSTAPMGEVPEFEIRPRRGWVAIDFKELLHYRELLYFLTWRDVKVRYKQTVLGFAWAILQPLMMVVIQTVIFGTVAGFASRLPPELMARNIPYSLFNYAGVLAWTLFATGVTSGGTSLTNQQNLLTKIYFPRLFVPMSVVAAAIVDALISLGMFFVLMAWDRVMPPMSVLLIPLLLLLTALASVGFAFIMASLTVTYRDFRFLLPFMVQAWQFLSPVGYPLDPRRQWIRWLLRLNPMYGIINAYRSVLLKQHWDFPGFFMSIGEVAVILLFGLYYFKKTERRFADIA
jgi:lipopolysaccharide transport system permease protein